MGPLFSGLPWAPVSFPNYPAGSSPWSGTPILVAPATDYFTPSPAFAPTAQNLNSMFNQRDLALLSIAQQTLALDGINWPNGLTAWSAVLVGGSYTGSWSPVGAPTWMPALGVWYMSAISTTASTNETVGLYVSADGHQWSYAGALFAPSVFSALAGGIVGRATDAALLAIGEGFGVWSTTIVNQQTGSVIHTSSVTGSIVPALGSNCWCSGTYFLGTTWVWWSGGSSTNPPAFTTSDTTNFAAAVTWAPPAGFVIHNTAHIDSPTSLLLFPSGTAVVSAYMRTTDGQNWSQQAMFALASGESVIDATYDSVGGNYYVLTSTASACRVWTSTTGLAGSWAVVGNPIAHQGYGLKANGPELLLWIHYATAAWTPDHYQGVQSIDGGNTWYFTSLMDTAAPGAYFALRANGGQYVYSNGAGGSFAASALSGAKLTQLLF